MKKLPRVCRATAILLMLFTSVFHLSAQNFTKQLLTENLNRPWEMLYGPDDMLWVTQSGGRVSRVDPNSGAITTIYTADDYLAADASRTRTLQCGTWQLTSGTFGMALHPDFLNQPYVYFIYSFNAGSTQNVVPAFKVRRLTWNAATSSVTGVADIITDLPLDLSHEGLRMIIVPEEGTHHFYITTGDGTIDNDACYPAGNNENLRAQNWNSRFGKTLRYNLDGTIPASNPVAGSPVYSTGHRNALGLAYNPATGILYSSENGKRSDDEINIIQKAKNYGWPKARGYHNDNNYPGEQDFVTNYTPAPGITGDALKEAMYSWCTNPVTFPEDEFTSTCIVAPSDMLYYAGNGIPEFANSLLVTTIKNFNGEHARVFQFKLNDAGTGFDNASPNPVAFFTDPGNLRYRDITTTPDGKTIFVCTDTWEGIGNKIFKFTYLEANLSVSAQSGTEAGATVITVNVTATGPVTGNQTFTLSVTGAGITAGDYTLSNATITIPDGQSVGTATFTIVDDVAIEGTETALLTISNPSAGISLGAVTTQHITIFDNEVANYYPRTNATDLSLPSDWTSDAAGVTTDSPTNFSTPGQCFNIIRNPAVTGNWSIAQGANVFVLVDEMTFGPSAVLSVGAGSTFNFGGNLGYHTIFKSDVSGTFSLAQVAGSIVNANQVTVERFISSAGNRAYRQLAPAVNTSTSIFANWQENGLVPPGYGTHITGSKTGEGGLDATQTGNPGLYILNDAGTAWIAVVNTKVLPDNTTTHTLHAKTGYLLYVRGDRNVDLHSNTSSNNTVLRAKGQLLSGDQVFDNLVPGNYNFITNPFASAIDWYKVYDHNGGAAAFESDAMVYYDLNIGNNGAYVYVQRDGTVAPPSPATTTPRYLQTGQAFWVKPTTGINQVTVHEEDKVSINNLDVFRANKAPVNQLQASIFYNDINRGRRISDGVISKFGEGFSAAVSWEDVEKISNFDEDVAIRRHGINLSKESRPLIDDVDTLPIYIAKMKQQAYEWQFDPGSFDAPDLQAYLQDKFLNTETQISLSDQTIVPFNITADAHSSTSDRFRVVFRTIQVLPINFTNVKAFEKGNAIQVEWNLGNEQSVKKYEIEKSIDGRTFTTTGSQDVRPISSTANYQFVDGTPNTGNNYYRIKAIENGGLYKYSQVVNVKTGKGNSDISVYPNPVKGKQLNVQFVNQPKGKYAIKLINNLGQEVYRSEFNHIGGSASETLNLGASVVKGVYQLQVKGAQNTTSKVVVE